MVNKPRHENELEPNKIRITGLSLPEGIVKSIDSQRGDISRSKYILRIIEKNLPSKVSNFGQKVVASEIH
jgi:hypothetical protein